MAANLVVNLLGKTGNFDRAMGGARGSLNRLTTEAELLGKIGNSVFRKLAAAASSLAAVFGARAVINAATTQIQAERKLAAVLKSTGHAAGLTAEQIRDYASELQSLTNFGDELTINAAAQLATFTSVSGEAFKRALAVAQDMSAVMDQDLRTSIVMIGKVLNDPVRNLSAASRAGVQFTQSQREMIQALAQSGDMLGAQTIVLSELEKEFGGAAKGTADPLVQLKNILGDLAENIGFLILPAVQRLAKGFSQLFGGIDSETFRKLGQSFANLGPAVLGFAAGLGAVQAALFVYRRAQQGATAAAIFFQAVLNPATLLKVAAGIAGATAAVLAMNAAFDTVAVASDEATQATKQLAKAVESLPGVVEPAKSIDELAGKLFEARQRLVELRTARQGAAPELGEFFAKPVIDSIDKLLTFQDELSESQQRVHDLRDALSELGLAAHDIGMDQAEALRSRLEDQILKASGVADKIEEAQRKADLASGKKSIIDVALEDAAKIGALPQHLEDLRDALVALEETERRRSEQQEMLSKAQSIFDATRTPEERLRSQLAELQKLQASGFIDDETMARAIGQAREEFLASVPDAPRREDPGGPAALAKGTREAFSAIFGAGRREDAQKQVAKNTEKANKLAEKVIGGIKGVEKAVEGLVNNFPVADIEG